MTVRSRRMDVIRPSVRERLLSDPKRYFGCGIVTVFREGRETDIVRPIKYGSVEPYFGPCPSRASSFLVARDAHYQLGKGGLDDRGASLRRAGQAAGRISNVA